MYAILNNYNYSLPGITNTAGPSEIQPVIISVTEDGLLVSHNILGYAMVLVTATDDQGLIHTLNFIVQVGNLINQIIFIYLYKNETTKVL